MKKIYSVFISIFSIIVLSTPALISLASVTDFKDLVNTILIGGILKPIVPLLIGLAVVVFVYGVLVTMLAEGGEKKEDGKKYMLWGIIGIFVMVSVWGLVAIFKSSFDLDNTPITIKIG